MAKSTNIYFALIFSLILVMMFIVESRPTPTVAVPTCDTIHAVAEAETCSSIVQKFNLLEAHFLEINPNINCVGIFVGQWVCVEGEVN
ncbi:putative LysM domain-containing protein [Medicago truncatula]|uniref:LysM domain protein n=1 Tax=Medicago truncatula TaxID=3880 RepID=G7JRT6_MEDTR|nr:LysM domain protein [Medicago truncatula]RHN62509.1 putative LysM domain-containing protein [Medicago truncatula]